MVRDLRHNSPFGQVRCHHERVTDALPADPRPLLGEPLPLDLLDTHWIDGTLQDLLVDTAGLAVWLRSADLPHPSPAPTEAVLATLRTTRDAIEAVARGGAGERGALNAVLAHGRRVRSVGADGLPRTTVELDDETWRTAWTAADAYLDLLERSPQRIKSCAHPQCVLWYLDTTRAGTRRWCSMAICGNRAKAERHYRRSRG